MNGPIFPFPHNIAKWQAKWEGRLRDNLTLEEIEKIEQQIAEQTTDKTRGIAIQLLNRFEAKKPALIDRQITLLNKASDVQSKIKLLTPLIGYMEPEAIESRIQAIEMDLSLEKNQKVQTAAKKQLEHLRFAEAQPVIYDLNLFIDRARRVAKEVLKLNSLGPMYAGFNAAQLYEISRGG